MSRKKIIPSEVADTIYESIVATPKRQKRLKSSTFWDMFGYSHRSAGRVVEVAGLLAERNITCSPLEGTFGKEGKDEWLILSVLEPPRPPGTEPAPGTTLPAPMPADPWFEQMAAREYESEREVEHYFVLPLLEQLGYSEQDIAIGQTVEMFEGVKRVKKEADVMVYNGRGRSPADTLIVVETKDSRRAITADHAGQARGYAMWTRCPYYVVTNGMELDVWLFRGAVQQDVRILHADRGELKAAWPSLYAKLSREAVVGYKKAMEEAADHLGESR